MLLPQSPLVLKAAMARTDEKDRAMRKFLVVIGAAALLAVPTMASSVPADVEAALANADRIEQDLAQDEARQPVRLLGFLGLEQGDTVFDFGATAGYYSELIARAVGPDGSVMAHNPPRFIEAFNFRGAIDARGYGERLPNAVSLERATDAVNFVPSSVDFALFNLVFHDLWTVIDGWPSPVSQNPAAFLERLFEGMRPGGIVGIVDHVANTGAEPAVETNRAHRVDPGVIQAMMEEAGFVLEEEADFLRNPEDDHQMNVFNPEIRGRTDRIVYRFRRPNDSR